MSAIVATMMNVSTRLHQVVILNVEKIRWYHVVAIGQIVFI